MAKYGNILTVFNCTAQQITAVEAIFVTRKTDFEKKGNAYFIETTSKRNTSDVVADLTAMGIEFIFFHNNNSDGSRVESFLVTPPDILPHIKRILFE